MLACGDFLCLKMHLYAAHDGTLAPCYPAADVPLYGEAYHARRLSVLIYADTKFPTAGIVNGGNFNINACLGLLFQGNFIFIQHVLLGV